MIGQLRELVPRHNRRTFTRIVMWGSMVLCTGLWANFMYRPSRVQRADTVFQDYFSTGQLLGDLRAAAADSIVQQARHLSGRGVFDGWVNMARWLEAMQRFGEQRGMVVGYRLDTLGTIPGGAPDIHPVPVRFKINSANHFSGVVEFLNAVCSDSSVAVRLEKTEMFSGAGGLDEAAISITVWIHL